MPSLVPPTLWFPTETRDDDHRVEALPIRSFDNGIEWNGPRWWSCWWWSSSSSSSSWWCECEQWLCVCGATSSTACFIKWCHFFKVHKARRMDRKWQETISKRTKTMTTHRMQQTKWCRHFLFPASKFTNCCKPNAPDELKPEQRSSHKKAIQIRKRTWKAQWKFF